MTEDESEPDPTSDEEFAEMIHQQREQRIERVTFEWVETVREAGEAYRETGDIEAVAVEIDEDEETTEEALTAYRLLFEKKPMWTGSKAIEPGRAYFSLDRELKDGYDSVESTEPAEDLLREYVGGLYLEEDVDEEPVGDPPEANEPPVINIAEMLETAVLPTLADSLTLNTNLIATAVTQPTLSAIQEQLDGAMWLMHQREELLSDQLAFLAHGFTENLLSQTLSNIATVFETTDLLSETNPPQSVLADLQQINTTAAIGASVHSPADSLGDVADPPTSTEYETPEVTEEIDDSVEPSDEYDDADVTEYLNWEARYAEAHADGSSLATEQSPVDVDPEIPVLIAYRIVSEGETYRWLSSLGSGHRITIVSGIIYTAAVACGFQYPGGIAVFGTAIEEYIFASDDSDDA